MNIGQRIQKRRLDLGLDSLEKFVAHIEDKTGKKFAWQTAQLWEKEGGTAPSRKNLPFVATALGCTVEWLQSEAGDPDGKSSAPRPELKVAEPVQMILQFIDPDEYRLLENYRLSLEEGRKKIRMAAEGAPKRPRQDLMPPRPFKTGDEP